MQIFSILLIIDHFSIAASEYVLYFYVELLYFEVVMKGLVFTSLQDYIEKKYSYDLVDEAIIELNLSSSGIYSSLGYYEFDELVELVQFYASKVDRNVSDVLTDFGSWLFAELYKTHESMVIKYDDPINFLANIEKHIHYEVKKMYPSVSLPKIKFSFDDHTKTAVLEYSSHRPLASLCIGLVTGCLQHFGALSDADLKNSISDDGHAMQLTIKL